MRLYQLKHVRNCYRCMCSSNAPQIKYNGSLTKFRDSCDKYLLERNVVTHNFDKQKFNKLIIDETTKQELCNVFDVYEEVKKTGLYPLDFSLEVMKYMMSLPNDELRRKHLRYLFIREFNFWRNEKLRVKKKKSLESETSGIDKSDFQIGVFDANNNIQYGYWRNSMFSRYYKKAHRKQTLSNLRNATVYGQLIIVDCSYDEPMADYEIKVAASDMSMVYHANRISQMPYDLHFCNFDPNSRLMRYFREELGIGVKPDNFVNCHEESYLELFADKRLIYLTPHARKVMPDYDHNAIYIIGAIVDHTFDLHLSLFKARYERIEYYKLPIHLYLNLNNFSTKIMHFSEVLRILNSYQQNPDWKSALTSSIKTFRIRK